MSTELELDAEGMLRHYWQTTILNELLNNKRVVLT
jgi:hypothetical protein